MVFESVFPRLVQALADSSQASLPEVHKAALIFLYRLLFVLYAEDRGLLPVNDSRYDDYGLRKRVRDDIARRMGDRDTYSAHATTYYDHLTTLFRIIDQGDASIGLPPYNGGLFASQAAPLLETVRLPDAQVAPVIYDLSHAKDLKDERHFVNYRDMSVQQLGSIYERLLEREPVRENGGIAIRPNPYARKDSGSFFTPQELVDLIVERTLKPLAEERLKAFKEKAGALKSDRRPKDQRLTELLRLDPAEAVLNLKVLDPAMGSGHFLVTAVDFLSDYVAELIEKVAAVPEWLDGGYASPLVGRVAAIRDEIIRRADESNWVLDQAQLTDQAIIRRMVLKRCIYGVDKNPLTVELAKVSLWLHSFTVGAPLSFLDHHLRCGDSLVGMRVAEAVRGPEPVGRAVCPKRHPGRGDRNRRNAAHRGDVRLRRGRGAGVGGAVQRGGADHRGPARPARHPLRLALAHGRHEEEGARGLRGTAGRHPWPALGGSIQAFGPGAGTSPQRPTQVQGMGAVRRTLERSPRHRRPGGFPALGGRLSGGVAPVAG